MSNDGFAAYKSFRKTYKLNVVQRQSGTSKEQQEFRDILMRLRNGESTLTDWKNLCKRVEQKLNKADADGFKNATFILTKWSEVNAINIEQLQQLNVPVAKLYIFK